MIKDKFKNKKIMERIKREKIVNYILEIFAEELEGQKEIRDLELLVDISADIEDRELINNIWLARRSNELEEWLSVEFYSKNIGKVIIITQEAFRSVSGANSRELVEELVDILLSYEKEAEKIEKMLEERLENQEPDEDVVNWQRGER